MSPRYCVPQGTVFLGVLCPQGTVFPRVLCSPWYCVPQGTVLTPLMFLLYINDIGENVTSHIKLFADDCLLFRTIGSVADTVDSVDDTIALQNDLCKMSLMAWKWQMMFNPEKCYTLQM